MIDALHDHSHALPVHNHADPAHSPTLPEYHPNMCMTFYCIHLIVQTNWHLSTTLELSSTSLLQLKVQCNQSILARLVMDGMICHMLIYSSESCNDHQQTMWRFLAQHARTCEHDCWNVCHLPHVHILSFKLIARLTSLKTPSLIRVLTWNTPCSESNNIIVWSLDLNLLIINSISIIGTKSYNIGFQH
jgi:hypothetical protein